MAILFSRCQFQNAMLRFDPIKDSARLLGYQKLLSNKDRSICSGCVRLSDRSSVSHVDKSICENNKGKTLRRCCCNSRIKLIDY
jgi:hypothetical protein